MSFHSFLYKTIHVSRITTDLTRDTQLKKLSQLFRILDSKVKNTNVIVTVKEINLKFQHPLGESSL